MIFHEKLILFFKKHNLYDEEMFNYFKENSTMIDYRYEEHRIFVGCFYIFDKNQILTKIHLTLPYIYDEKTMLISIHEVIHGIELYTKINKKIKITDNCEILPMLYEKIYIEETQNEELQRYHKELDEKITKKDKKYFIALSVREELYNKYNYNFKTMQNKAKRLSRKYEKNSKHK